jgi:hypothetical protein
MSLNYPALHDAGAVTGATGAAVWSAGDVLPARTGPGVYTLTRGLQIDPTQRGTHVSCRNALDFNATVVETSDAVSTVNTFNQAGVATDTDFSWLTLAAPFNG